MSAEANATIVREFIAAWSSLDTDRLVNYFTDDGIYHNIPTTPVQGREKLCSFVAELLRGWTKAEWEITNLVASGNVVVAERIDRIELRGKHIDLPCCGVFELRDGKIAVWRDYFDVQTYMKALA